MDLAALPDADELWWRFAIVAAVGISGGQSQFSHNPTEQVFTYNDGTVLVAMQRLYHGRVVLWGRHESVASLDRWTGIPGWATSDAVRGSLEQSGATFLLWHAHDGWESPTADQDIADALAVVLDSNIGPALISAAQNGTLDDQELAGLGAVDPSAARRVLEEASGEAPPVQGAVRRFLAAEIEAQMRLTPDRDRLLPQRPVPLVRWCVVARPPGGFTYAVRASANGLIRTNDFVPRLAENAVTSLHHVLTQLYYEEASQTSGGWLFARVRFNGVQVHLDRAFDGQPLWSPKSLSLEELSLEMNRRDPAWRPAWALLLPPASA